MTNDKNKDILGMAFFALSILVLAYMFITPLNQLIGHIDEYFTMTLVTLPVQDILTATAWDVHPPLYYLMGKVAVKLSAMLGMNLLYGLKLLSIVPYIIILIISAVKIRKDYGWFAAGLFAFSLVATSEFFRYYLIARMYSWAILFLLLSFLCFKQIIEESDRKYWILLAVFAVLGAYTHYFAAIAGVCIYLILLFYISTCKKDEIRNWVISTVTAIVLYLPWIFPLMNQLSAVHESYWIPEVTSDKIILSLGYFVYNGDILFAIVGIIILAAIIFIFTTQSKNIDQKELFIVLGGLGVYFGTIILGIIISVVFKPILVPRYLMPATAILWLSISIILSKIENKKTFMISFALICLLLISGVATVIATNGETYDSGMAQKEILDTIAQDNNSMVIVNAQNMIMYFLDYSNTTDMHCLNVSHVFGVNTARLHKIYDFEDINGADIDSLVTNNSDKNIYFISWNSPPQLNSTLDVLDEEVGVVFSKVNSTIIPDESTYY